MILIGISYHGRKGRTEKFFRASLFRARNTLFFNREGTTKKTFIRMLKRAGV